MNALKAEVERLSAEVHGLRRLAVGQSAQIALLVGLLASRGSLGHDEAILIASAGNTEGLPEELTPEKVREWAASQIASRARSGGRPDRPKSGKSPSG